MIHTDLRPESPPLGFHAQEVPLIDVTAVMDDLDRYRMPNTFGHSIVDVFDVPGEAVVLRAQMIDVSGPQNLSELRTEVEEANRHFTLLHDGLQISVPPHRHIGAAFPLVKHLQRPHQKEGQLITLANRLIDYQPLDMNRSKKDLQSGIMVLDGLTKYITRCLHLQDANPRFLSDIFQAKQISVNERGTNPVLHDTDMILDEVETGNGYEFRRAVGELHTFAAAAARAAQGNATFEMFTVEIQSQLNQLPPPIYTLE